MTDSNRHVSARSTAALQSGWGSPVRLWQPRNPAYWLYVVFVVWGGFLWLKALLTANVSGSTLAISVLLQALYTLPFVWFITRIDRYEREPAKLALLAFLWGGLASTWLMAGPANGEVLSLYGKLIGIDFAVAWGPALTAPFTEETAKLTGVVMMALLARPHVRSAYDGMLLGMFVGLGFQVFENVQYLTSFVEGNFNSRPTLDMLVIFVLRGLTGVWGHWLFSGLCGAGVGYFFGRTDKSLANRLGVAAAFIAFAMLCHGIFDAGGGLGPMAMVIATIMMTIGIVVAWKFAGRRVRPWMRGLLEEEVAAGTVTPAELDVLAGPQKNRRAYLQTIKRAAGKPAAKQAAWVLEAATELAAAIAATNDPQSAEARAARSEVARLRALPAS